METWKKINYTNFKHYEISNTGKIRSIDRIIHRSDGISQNYNGKILSLRNNKIEPHLFCELYGVDGHDNKIRKTVYIHRAVMEHFGVKIKNNHYKYVEHIDNDYSNNNIENLRWITWEQLYAKQIKNGRVERMDLYIHSPLWKKAHKNIA